MSHHQTIQDEIAALESKLSTAKSRLAQLNNSTTAPPPTPPLPNNAALHTLVLLADSALPLGSFAFSSGLESFLAHRRLQSPTAADPPAVLLDLFLALSLHALAGTALPYVVAAWRTPAQVQRLDNDFDASTPCIVARRASVTQGRALLAVWERSFGELGGERGRGSDEDATAARRELIKYASTMKKHGEGTFAANAHFAPLWGVVTRVLEVPLAEAAYLFLFSHGRAVVSAAVRANVLGPYQAQRVLAGRDLRARIEGLVEEYWNTEPEDAGQNVPAMDLWVGRHEKLYSRIFNS
jgi:urease accessory protein